MGAVSSGGKAVDTVGAWITCGSVVDCAESVDGTDLASAVKELAGCALLKGALNQQGHQNGSEQKVEALH